MNCFAKQPTLRSEVRGELVRSLPSREEEKALKIITDQGPLVSRRLARIKPQEVINERQMPQVL